MASSTSVWLFVCVAILTMTGCARADEEAPPSRADAPRESVEPPHQVRPAFGGRLLGWDFGEFEGELVFEDEAGQRHLLVKDNVHGMIENRAGIFVFTGLAHMSESEGAIYRVTRDGTNRVKATMLTTLPGAPSEVRQGRDGVTTFWITPRDSGGDRAKLLCYALVDERYGRYQGCGSP